MTGEDQVEQLARAIYEDRWKGCANIWDWDSSGLDDEHPGSRDEYLRAAQAAIAFLKAGEGEELAPVGWREKVRAFAEPCKRHPHKSHLYLDLLERDLLSPSTPSEGKET